MTEYHEEKFQPNKKQGKFSGIVISIAICSAIIFGAKFLGRQAGRQRAMQKVKQESIEQNAPMGFMGAEWLMSMSQVKSLFPDATEFVPGNLKLATTAFERPAFVDFLFTDNLLLIVIITFKGEKTESMYKQTHILVKKEYGSFPEPIRTNEHILYSKKRIGRIIVEHILYQQFGIPIEQVMLYRTKENNAY